LLLILSNRRAAIPPGQEVALKKILLVEDDAVVNLDQSLVLKGAGYDVVCVADAARAIAAARDETPPVDLILMDMLMKGLDGMSACKSIQRMYPNQKLVILSGYAPEKYENQVEALGLDCLTKPCQDADLARAVRSRLYA